MPYAHSEPSATRSPFTPPPWPTKPTNSPVSYQREGQLDDEADYQTAYQSARTGAVNPDAEGPIASLRAGPQHKPTVDGMEEVRGSSPLSSTK